MLRQMIDTFLLLHSLNAQEISYYTELDQWSAVSLLAGSNIQHAALCSGYPTEPQSFNTLDSTIYPRPWTERHCIATQSRCDSDESVFFVERTDLRVENRQLHHPHPASAMPDFESLASIEPRVR